MNDNEIFIVGSGGQLGLALQHQYPQARHADVDELDITDKKSVEEYDWSGIKVLINAAAYTNVDGAETLEGRVLAWAVNADAVANLVAVAAQYNMILVHISTDYVFDGTQETHTEDEAFSPLSTYGASKAAGDIAVSLAPKFYILRTSWVIGDGKNFVRSMMSLAHQQVEPAVVADQFGRPTFTAELVKVLVHLLNNKCAFGTYNVSNGGDVVSWAEVAREVYKIMGSNLKVSDTTAAEYFAGKIAAPRPVHSAFDLTKLHNTGFKSTDWRQDLKQYIGKEARQ